MAAPGTTALTARDFAADDPPSTTPFEVVDEHGLMRLRHYRLEHGARHDVVLLVYSLIKRPYILDLLPDRSVVRRFLEAGFSVYMIDWLPPGADDVEHGLDAYVNHDLAHAVDCVRNREGVEQISMVGCCFGGLLAVIYAALYPRAVRHLVPFALPFELRTQPFPPMLGYWARAFGNIPAWLLRATLNARVQYPFQLRPFLTEELGEPELARSSTSDSRPPVELALQRWLNSDVPLSGRIMCELMDAYWSAQFVESQLRVGGQRVALERVRCPVLNIIAERDRLVPPQNSAGLIEHVGSRDASNLVFPTGHLGLMVGRAAHRDLWPRVATRLGTQLASPEHTAAAVAL